MTDTSTQAVMTKQMMPVGFGDGSGSGSVSTSLSMRHRALIEEERK